MITRFAPSPSGHLHLGGARTALFNYLASANNGEFILRFDDTDKTKSNDKYKKAIIKDLEWLGIKYDKKFSQSDKERVDSYESVAYKLLDNEKAYKENGCVKMDDFVIMRSDGSATYHLASAVDDYDMNITHIIRGVDHVDNSYKQRAICDAMGWTMPKIQHAGLVKGQDGKPLSKRNGSKSVGKYREEGILPQALLNYMVRLGWSHGDQEIFSIEEMIELFDLHKIKLSPARIDENKLKWLNKKWRQYD